MMTTPVKTQFLPFNIFIRVLADVNCSYQLGLVKYPVKSLVVPENVMVTRTISSFIEPCELGTRLGEFVFVVL